MDMPHTATQSKVWRVQKKRNQMVLKKKPWKTCTCWMWGRRHSSATLPASGSSWQPRPWGVVGTSVKTKTLSFLIYPCASIPQASKPVSLQSCKSIWHTATITSTTHLVLLWGGTSRFHAITQSNSILKKITVWGIYWCDFYLRHAKTCLNSFFGSLWKKGCWQNDTFH